MNTNEKLNHIYKLYSEKKYSEAFVLLEEILKIEPENIYAKRYESLIKPYLNDKSSVWKIVTIKWKNLKCPHCVAAIWFSTLNEEQKTKIREGNYENLSLKCPYCHTTFTLQKKSENSIIWIKIGDKIFYKNKNYRVVWAVNYGWSWYEDWYSWALSYLEWILLGEDNSYLYFSEWYFYDDGEKNYEFEFSEKIIPDFSIKMLDNHIIINWITKKIWEKNVVWAKSLYWENSKVFSVWERVYIYSFSHNFKNYVLEKESAWRQSEAWVYETWSVSKSKAFEIFWKEMSSFEKVSDSVNILKKYFWVLFYLVFFPLFIIWANSQIPWEYIFYWIFIIIFLFLFFVFYKTKMFHLFFSWPIFAFLVFFIWNNIFENRQEISLKDITEGKKYEVLFMDESMIQTSEVSKVRYDYGWVETTYKKIKWFNFSVLTEQDKEIIKNLQNGENIPDETKKIFSEKIYKLK